MEKKKLKFYDRVVAKGVEDMEQVDFLRQWGCDVVPHAC